MTYLIESIPMHAKLRVGIVRYLLEIVRSDVTRGSTQKEKMV